MKVLMLNGSSKQQGNTYRALLEVGCQLEREGMEYEIFQLGGQPVRDCIGCGKCAESCPQHTIAIEQRKARIAYRECIRCYCCHELCPHQAVALRKGLFARIFH